jgi:hypothetical protein
MASKQAISFPNGWPVEVRLVFLKWNGIFQNDERRLMTQAAAPRPAESAVL